VGNDPFAHLIPKQSKRDPFADLIPKKPKETPGRPFLTMFAGGGQAKPGYREWGASRNEMAADPTTLIAHGQRTGNQKLTQLGSEAIARHDTEATQRIGESVGTTVQALTEGTGKALDKATGGIYGHVGRAYESATKKAGELAAGAYRGLGGFNPGVSQFLREAGEFFGDPLNVVPGVAAVKTAGKHAGEIAKGVKGVFGAGKSVAQTENVIQKGARGAVAVKGQQASPAKVAAKEPGAYGLARRFEAEGHVDPRTNHVRVKDLAEEGRKLLKKGSHSVEAVYKKVERGERIEPEDAAVGALRGKEIQNRTQQLYKLLDSSDLDNTTRTVHLDELHGLEQEMERILDVAHNARGTFHQMGQALQVAFGPDFSTVGILAKARREWPGTLPKHFEEELTSTTKALSEAQKELAELREQLGKTMFEGSGVRSKNPLVKREALVKNILRDTGLGERNLAGLSKAPVIGGGLKNKQAGAVNIPPGAAKRLNSAVTRLSKLYIEEGATSLNDVLARFKQDLPMLSEDDVLGLLSGKYKEAVLQADIKRTGIDAAMRKVRAGAEWRQKTTFQKGIAIAADAIESFGRQIQTAGDLGGMMLQGLPSAFVSPTTFAKGWGQMGRAVANIEKGQPVAQVETLRRIFSGSQAHEKSAALLRSAPEHAFAKKAGVSFTDVDGAFSMQEEQIAGHLLAKLREARIPIGNVKVPIPGVGQAAGLLQRTNEGFADALNHTRQNLFKKFVNGQWDSADHMRDAARLANILTGRGDGKMAQALSNRNFAYVAYAPRFMLSTFQNAALPLLLPTFKTGAGKTAALSAWSKQAAGVLGAVYAAKQLKEMGVEGYDGEIDIRSKEFGTIYTPWGSFNLFKKITDPAQFVGQQIGGTISKKGDYYPPSLQNNASGLGYYASGKAAPVSRLGYQVAAGQRYNDDGEVVPFNIASKEGALEALKGLSLPISTQEAMRNDGDLSAWIFGLLNINYKPKSKVKQLAEFRPPWRDPKPRKVGLR